MKISIKKTPTATTQYPRTVSNSSCPAASKLPVLLLYTIIMFRNVQRWLNFFARSKLFERKIIENYEGQRAVSKRALKVLAHEYARQMRIGYAGLNGAHVFIYAR